MLLLCRCEAVLHGRDVVFILEGPALPESATAEQRLQRWQEHVTVNPSASQFDAAKFVADMRRCGILQAFARCGAAGRGAVGVCGCCAAGSQEGPTGPGWPAAHDGGARVAPASALQPPSRWRLRRLAPRLEAMAQHYCLDSTPGGYLEVLRACGKVRL